MVKYNNLVKDNYLLLKLQSNLLNMAFGLSNGVSKAGTIECIRASSVHEPTL